MLIKKFGFKHLIAIGDCKGENTLPTDDWSKGFITQYEGAVGSTVLSSGNITLAVKGIGS